MSQAAEQPPEQHTDQHTEQRPLSQQAQDAQYYRRVLHDLIEIGADLARIVQRQAQLPAEATQPVDVPCPQDSIKANSAPENNDNAQSLAPQILAQAPAPAFDPTIAFDRIARAIRRTVILAQKLTEPVPAHTAPDQRTAARKHIIRAVEDTIQRKTKANEDAERLHAEFLDRLDEPDLDDDIASRPVGDIIKDICRDLGLDNLPDSHPWKRRTPADIALLAARAATRSPAEARNSSAPPDSSSTTIVAMRPSQRTVAGKTTDPP